MISYYAVRHVMLRACLPLVLLGWAQSAFAYLDPSTGSMVVSALVGLFASLALAIKTYWYRLKRLFRRDGCKPADPPEPPPADQ